MKARFRNFLPGVRWIPSDLPSGQQAAQKAKPKSHRNLFGLKKSEGGREGYESNHGAAVRRRKSTLSLTSIPDPELAGRTHAQAQSGFFAMLPLEVRKMVYEYVMGEETVHLTFSAKKRFGHFVCERHADLDGRECTCRVLVGGGKSEKLSSACARMLGTCRRMYSEAIPELYRPRTFSLLHLTHLLYLPSCLPQPRLNTIRTLHLRWAIRALPYLRRGNKLAYREDTSNWEKGWRILAEMQGLRDLYVVLVDPSPQDIWERNWRELEPKLLEAVKNVTRPQWFELVLPFASCNTNWDMGQSQVVLRTPDSGFVEEHDED